MSEVKAPSSKSKSAVFLFFTGIAIAVIPTILAIITYFPIWRSRSAEAVLSGGALLLLAIALIPLYKLFKEYFRSPSAPLVWFIIFLGFLTVRSIADEMVVISFVGFISNLIASFFFKSARKRIGGKVN